MASVLPLWTWGSSSGEIDALLLILPVLHMVQEGGISIEIINVSPAIEIILLLSEITLTLATSRAPIPGHDAHYDDSNNYPLRHLLPRSQSSFLRLADRDMRFEFLRHQLYHVIER